jgi:hypothetical protein
VGSLTSAFSIFAWSPLLLKVSDSCRRGKRAEAWEAWVRRLRVSIPPRILATFYGKSGETES